MYPI
jgi:hypothetical protein